MVLSGGPWTRFTDAELQVELARASKIVATVQAEIEQRKADRLQVQAERREIEATRRRLAEREAKLDERAATRSRTPRRYSSGLRMWRPSLVGVVRRSQNPPCADKKHAL